MEATLQIICYFGNIRNINILIVLVVVFCELKINFLSEEKFKEKVHQLTVFFLLEILVSKHHHTTTNDQLSSAFLMLIDCTNRSIAGISQRARSKDSISWVCNSQWSPIDINKINSRSLWLFLILFLIFFSTSHHKSIVVSPFGLLRISIYDSSNFFIENSIVDVGLFWMEVFVKRCADHTVRVDCDTKLLCCFAYVCIVSILKIAYFLSPPSCENMRRLPPFSTSFLRSSI